MSIRSLAVNMELPGRCSDWLAPPPSPPRAPRLNTTRRARGGDFYLAKTGDLNWPPVGTFSWPRTAHRELIRGGFAKPHQGSLRGLRAFIPVANSVDETVLRLILRDLAVSEVETAWRDLHMADPKQLRPLLELALRENVAVTAIARELLADSIGPDRDCEPSASVVTSEPSGST